MRRRATASSLPRKGRAIAYDFEAQRSRESTLPPVGGEGRPAAAQRRPVGVGGLLFAPSVRPDPPPHPSPPQERGEGGVRGTRGAKQCRPASSAGSPSYAIALPLPVAWTDGRRRLLRRHPRHPPLRQQGAQRRRLHWLVEHLDGALARRLAALRAAAGRDQDRRHAAAATWRMTRSRPTVCSFRPSRASGPRSIRRDALARADSLCRKLDYAAWS